MDKKNQMKYNCKKHAPIVQHQNGLLPQEDAGGAPVGRTNDGLVPSFFMLGRLCNG